ncbi:MAG: aldehyde dehydrogenase family protein [Paludibaculum sp.]
MQYKLSQKPRGFDHFIHGRSVAGVSAAEITRYSPAHGVPVSTYRDGTVQDVNEAVSAARHAFDHGDWPRLGGEGRAAVLLRAAALIRENCEELALVETLESGKPIAQSRGEVMGAAGIWEYAAGAARTIHGDSFNSLGGGLFGLALREPIGVVGIITPWNFPFFILAERLPFVLGAGCTVVLKPSEFTSGTTVMMAGLLQRAGLPDGVVNVVTGYGDPAGRAITEHMDVDMVSFTGSTAVGRSTLIASARNIKKVGLELGGKNPQLVFADADLDAAADGVLFGVCFNSGQCCVSGSRLLAHRSIVEPLAERIVDLARRVRVGDPLEEETQMGAIVNEKQMGRILGYIREGCEAGAKLLCGGARVPGTGLFVEPTVFTGVRPDMSIATDEIFGPVLGIQAFDTVEESLAIANGTEYGLSASIWTRDLDTALRASREVKAGRVWVNTTITGGPEMPIGGFKQSGLGRETGRYGIEEYTEVKAVQIQMGGRAPWVKE